MTRTLRLGLRLARGAGRSGWLRLALMTAGGAVATLGLLCAWGLYGLMPHQQARADRLTLQTGVPGTPPAAGVLVDQESDSWDGRRLQRVNVAVTGTDPIGAPGIERWPAPGEAVLSPALARLAEREPLVARRFPQRVTGTIDRSGLVTPDDLVAYVGVEADDIPDVLAVPLTGFGRTGTGGWYKSVTSRTLAVLVVLTLVAPALMLMGTCTRLSATTRTQRLAALRLLGLSRRRTQLANAVETGLAGLAGGLAGTAAWLAWLRAAPEGRMGSLSWYAADLALPAAALAAVLAGVVVLAVAVGAAGSRTGVRDPLPARREGSVRKVSAWRIVPLAAGFALLALSWQTAGKGAGHASLARWLAPFGTGLALSALGLALAVPFVAVAVGRLLQRWERPATLLAGGRLRHEPAVAGRILAGLTMAVFAAGTAQVVLVSVRAGALALEKDPFPRFAAMETDVPMAAGEADLRAVSDRGVAFRLVDFTQGVDGVAATCEDLRAATGDALAGCQDGRTYRVRSPDPDYGDATAAEGDAALVAQGLPPVDGILSFELRGPNSLYVPDLVVPPSLAPRSARWFVVFNGDPGTAQRAVAALAERFPAARYNAGLTGVDRMDTPRLYTDVIAHGTVAALAIGLLALVVASIDRAVERRAVLTHVAALGTPARTIRSALALQTLPVSVLALTAAGLTAVVGGSSYLRWDSEVDAVLPVGIMVALTALAVAASVLATALALAGTVARARPDLLRSE